MPLLQSTKGSYTNCTCRCEQRRNSKSLHDSHHDRLLAPVAPACFIRFCGNYPGSLGACQTMSKPVKYGHDDRRRTDLSASATGAARRTDPAAASVAVGAKRLD